MPIVTSIGVNRSNDTFYPIRIDRSEFPWGLYEERFPTMILIDDARYYVSTDRLTLLQDPLQERIARGKKKCTIRSYWKNWLDTTNSPSIEENAESAIRYLNLARLFTTADVINCGG